MGKVLETIGTLIELELDKNNLQGNLTCEEQTAQCTACKAINIPDTMIKTGETYYLCHKMCVNLF